MSTTKPKPFDPGFTARDFALLAAALREEITAADRIRRRKLTLPLREVIPASFTGRPWVWALLTVAQLPAVTGWGKATLEDYLKGQAAVPFPPHTAEIGRRGNLYAAGDVACFAAQLAPAMRHDRGLNLEQREEIRRLRATGMGPAEIAPMFGLKNANTVYDIVHRRRSYADDVPAAAAKLPGTPPRGWTAEEEGLIRGLAMVNMFRDLIRADPRTVITEAKTAASAAGLPGRSQALAAAWLEARYWEAPHLISRCESMRNDGLVTSREAGEGFGVPGPEISRAHKAGELAVAAWDTTRPVRSPLFDPSRLRVRRDGKRTPADKDHELALPLPDERSWEEIGK